ncbi:MAG: GtrA family protein [Clostridia bacterium]|jgi:putative flippase GtrA|nr:GtrA family protein [Clostridia bacterium]MCI2000571.1 GtrA family protein [Clostridia bacterium]MCI2015027.1 GtrA family protein [Clostridia bacterium]
MDKSIYKFVGVGIINTIVGTIVMFGSYNIIGLSYWISSALNYIIGSIFSYFLNKHYTFKNKDRDSKSIPRFIINIITCYVIAYGFAKPAVRLLFIKVSNKAGENIALFFGLVLFTGLNYFGQRFFVFKK